MRCTDCKHSKELIPAEQHFMFCNKYRITVGTENLFDECWYRTTEEYKIKQLIESYCNKELNHIVCVDYDSLCRYVANNLDTPDATEFLRGMAYYKLRTRIDQLLKQTLKPYELASLQRFETWEYDVLILKEDEVE